MPKIIAAHAAEREMASREAEVLLRPHDEWKPRLRSLIRSIQRKDADA
jgi:FtsZ-binding cell division protein ZapB